MECEIIHFFQNKQDFSMFLSVNDFHKTIKNYEQEKKVTFFLVVIYLIYYLCIYFEKVHI